MTKLLDVVLEKLRTLPDEKQDEAAEVLMNFIAQREGAKSRDEICEQVKTRDHE